MASSGTPRATVIPIGSTLLALLLLSSALASALFFPQSELTLRLPYLLRDEDKSDLELTLLSVRTLKNDSTDARESDYEIASTSERVASFEPETREIVLHSVPKKNESRAIIVKAKRRGSDEEAILEIDVRPIGTRGDRINCADYVQDMCFWNVSKYRVYENRPVTMLGKMGPRVYRRLCPAFRITRYELLNGTDHFHIVNEEIFSNASLDRDSLEYPGGPGPRARVRVRCVVWDENTGNQRAVESHIDIDVLDEDDNPPIARTNSSLRINLRDFTVGDRLDDNDLMVTDADSTASNRYVVRILGDTHDALDITYDALPIEHPKLPDNPASTVIFTRIYSRTTLLPKSPYIVVLRVTDESLVPGHGRKSVDVTLSFVGPQRRATSTTTSVPLEKPISYPSVVTIARTSTKYSRLVQPSFGPNRALTFAITDSRIFNVTRKDGIVYVANRTLLRTAPSEINITIQWRSSEHGPFASRLTINLANVSVVDDSDESGRGCNGGSDASIVHSCANAVTRKECESMCGIASGSLHDNESWSGECAWRSNSGNNAAMMTEKYRTCSPDLSHCPDHVCDDLEHLDHRICPQDCTIESEVHFAEMNKRGRGILSGLGTCSCNDEMQCICGPVSLRRGNGAEDGNSVNSENGGKDSREASKTKRQREREYVVSDARKASDGAFCGPTCTIGAVSASFFLLTVIVGAFALWRYRYATKGSRRECEHRSNDDGTNALEISPSDYLDRGDDGRLIGLESFVGLNRSLLLPKAQPPDPKWEFPRSRLTIEQVLGEGEFGRVLRAKAIDIGGWPGATTVAVKTLKEDASGSELADLLSEYQLLKEAQHPNVVRLLGACTLPGATVYLIIEFAEFGSLRNYLRRSRHLESEGRVPCSTSLLSASPGNNRSDDFHSDDPPAANCAVTPRDILSFAWQISKGMAYLAEIKLVHRDLAARNVLLATGKVCKISDFGLTRDVYEDDAYLKRSKGRVPVKWMAPESLADHVYTSKSDVWSFGVLLWELVTLGASPYPGVDVHDLYNLLKAGYRMERPANCSAQLYKLMVSCWHDEPGTRPSFKELTAHWERMLEDGVEYLDLDPRTVHNQAYFASLHALDSPIGTNNEGTIGGNFNVVRNEAFNYLRKDSSEPPIGKSDKVDKLQALWQDPVASFPVVDEDNEITDRVTVDGGKNGGYVNDGTTNFNVNHYESPIEVTMDSSVTSTSENNCDLKKVRTSYESHGDSSNRPRSYVDMTAQNTDKILNDDPLLFNNVVGVDHDHDGKSNETKE